MNACLEREGVAGSGIPASDRWSNDTPPCATAEFPLDLREWALPSSVVVWIEEALQTLAQVPSQSPKDASGWAKCLQNASALRLLSLGYATGTYGSDEIAQLAISNPLFRVLSENEAPFATELSVARRHCRGALVAILGHVLMRALASRLKMPLELLPGTTRQGAFQAAVERVDIAGHMDNQE